MVFKLAFKHLFSKPFLTLFTLLAVAGSLSILGVFWTVVENLERVRVTSASVSPNANDTTAGITVYVDPKLSAAQIETLRQKLLATGKVSAADLIPAAEALKSLESQFGETLSKAFAGETLPVTLRLQLEQSSFRRDELVKLANDLRSFAGVLDVEDGLSSLPPEKLALSSRIFSWATAVLFLVFGIVALLVSHLIRIAFETLRSEVETLKILGASKFWIFRPLLLEGIFFGFFGALGSLALLGLAIHQVVPRFAAGLLPRGYDLVSLSWSSSGNLLALSLLASLVGALFTWPLIQKPATGA